MSGASDEDIASLPIVRRHTRPLSLFVDLESRCTALMCSQGPAENVAFFRLLTAVGAVGFQNHV